MTEKRIELQPCPFCGGAAYDASQGMGGPDNGHTWTYWQCCHICGTEGPRKRSREVAARAWNARTLAVTMGEPKAWKYDGGFRDIVEPYRLPEEYRKVYESETPLYAAEPLGKPLFWMLQHRETKVPFKGTSFGVNFYPTKEEAERKLNGSSEYDLIPLYAGPAE